MKTIALLSALLFLSGCAIKHGVAVYGWKSNVNISVSDDATQEGYVEATTSPDTNVGLK